MYIEDYSEYSFLRIIRICSHTLTRLNSSTSRVFFRQCESKIIVGPCRIVAISERRAGRQGSVGRGTGMEGRQQLKFIVNKNRKKHKAHTLTHTHTYIQYLFILFQVQRAKWHCQKSTKQTKLK